MIGGDFNNTPQHLKFVMEKWLKMIGGEICAPGNITCRSASGGITIYFYILDKRLTHGVRGIWTQMDFLSSPHYMVVLRIEATATRSEIMKIIIPKSFEPRPLVGCARKTMGEPSCLQDISEMEQNTVNDVFKTLINISKE